MIKIGVAVGLITLLLKLDEEIWKLLDAGAYFAALLPCGVLIIVACVLGGSVGWPILVGSFVVGGVFGFISKRREP